MLIISFLLSWFLWLITIRATVLIYSDVGTSKDLIEHLEYSLSQINLASRRILAKDLISDAWEIDCKLLVVPGGMEKEYVKTLALIPMAISRIRQYVEGGGRYLGICGGAYFAASRVEFEAGRKFSVVEDRPLALFPGIAYGAAIRPFSYQTTPKYLRTANIFINNGCIGRYASFYYMGGGWFEEEQVKEAGWIVLGRYAHSDKPALIWGKVGQGLVLLSGPHLEVDATQLKGKFWETTPLYAELLKLNQQRRKVFKRLLYRLINE